MGPFTPIPALVGGGLIGLSASILLFTTGRIAGISGILGGLLQEDGPDTRWRAAFIGGLVLAGILFAIVSPDHLGPSHELSPTRLVLAGLLVGVGVRMGSGCTSGHGVCGISRLRARSMVATATFVATGMATATALYGFGWNG